MHPSVPQGSRGGDESRALLVRPGPVEPGVRVRGDAAEDTLPGQVFKP
jgi:hypothetical protein